DCAPFASIHSLNGNDERQGGWAALIHEAEILHASGDFAGALGRYGAAHKLDPAVAEIDFRIAQTYLALPNAAKALKPFERARDHDALPFRADSELNRAVVSRSAGSDAKALALLDTIVTFSGASTNGIPGNDFFYDHVHLTFAGNYQLALGLAQQVHARLP